MANMTDVAFSSNPGNLKEKMAYFKEHWPSGLQEEVIRLIICVEEVVCVLFVCYSLHIAQFKKQYMQSYHPTLMGIQIPNSLHQEKTFPP